MKHPSIVPNAITAFSLSCGLFVIFKMNMIAPGMVTYENVLAATCILMLAAFLDLLDGAVARALKVESEFGGVFDSMADAVSFGVAPSVVILKTLSLEKGTLLSFFVAASALIYSISGVLRLVRFNVRRHQIQGDKEKIAEDKASFTGLPIPAAASLVTSASLLLMSNEFRDQFSLTEESKAGIVACIFFVIGYFMISRWKFPSLKTLHIRVNSFQVVLFTAIVSVIILACALQHFPLVFAGIAWAYFFISTALSVVRYLLGNRLKALSDFDPGADEEEI